MATVEQTWELKLDEISSHKWVHIAFTWNFILGLRYFENGRMIANTTSSQSIDKGSSDQHTFLTIGKAASTDKVQHDNLQLYGLNIWYSFISTEQVMDNYKRGKTFGNLLLY